MSTRLRALLFVLVAAIMQFAVVDLRHEGRVETPTLTPGAFADARFDSEVPLRAFLRDTAPAERGSQKTRADDTPSALATTSANDERAVNDLLAPVSRQAASPTAQAPRAHRPRGPPGTAADRQSPFQASS